MKKMLLVSVADFDIFANIFFPPQQRYLGDEQEATNRTRYLTEII